MILKQQKIFRLIAIICYLLIILNGEMIGLPFFLWLSFTLFDFGNIDQLFALFALIGLTINFINTNKERAAKILLLDIFCFLLMASPIVGQKHNAGVAAKPIKDTVGFQKITDNFYDIADLKTYKDTTKFIARLRYEPRFSTTSIIELDEIGNGINLCVKQPKAGLPYGDTLKGNRSLAFNQLCYWYADKEAHDIKALFNKFDNGKNKIDYHCNNCLDLTYWQIEIYDHGKYSSLRQDYTSKDDWSLTELIFKKVGLTKQNGYAIKY